jgi:hypothetical protein
MNTDKQEPKHPKTPEVKDVDDVEDEDEERDSEDEAIRRRLFPHATGHFGRNVGG